MARRGIGAGVITLIVIDVILILVLIVLLVTHPTTPGAGQDPQQNPTATAEEEEETTPPMEESAQTPDAEMSAPENAADIASFAMPSRNIWCELSESETLCYIGHYTYSPQSDQSCDGEVGSVVRLTSEGATFPCPEQEHGLAPDELPALEYEQDTVVGDFWCSSAESGVTCRATDTGRGFTLAVGGFTPF